MQLFIKLATSSWSTHYPFNMMTTVHKPRHLFTRVISCWWQVCDTIHYICMYIHGSDKCKHAAKSFVHHTVKLRQPSLDECKHKNYWSKYQKCKKNFSCTKHKELGLNNGTVYVRMSTVKKALRIRNVRSRFLFHALHEHTNLIYLYSCSTVLLHFLNFRSLPP